MTQALASPATWTPSHASYAKDLLQTLDATVLSNPWIPADPTPKQAAFLIHPAREVLYGGSAGGGKTLALLMGALQYVDRPHYNAILFRRTYRDLALPGALLDMAAEWLAGTAAHWNAQRLTWQFPSGATLTFGAMDLEQDKYKYQGTALHFCGFDELTQFSESQYRYLFSRLRRLTDDDIPIRMRAASNPGGRGHAWTKLRFLDTPSADRAFIPAGLADNPYLDVDAYRASLANLDPLTRAQLLNGDWTARAQGGYFRREWFPLVDDWPREAYAVRYWDLAATAPRAGADPDWTAGAKVAMADGVYYVVDVQHVRASPEGVEALIRQCAALDGPNVPVFIELEPGASGKSIVDHYQRHVLAGYAVAGDRVTGPKVTRARVPSAAAQAGNVRLVRGPWIADFLDEAEPFPAGSHDDQVDALSGAFARVNSGGWAVGEYYKQLREKQKEATRR